MEKDRKYMVKVTNADGEETLQEFDSQGEAEAHVEFFNLAMEYLAKEGLPSGHAEFVGITEDVDPSDLSPEEREIVMGNLNAIKDQMQASFSNMGFRVVDDSEFAIENKEKKEIPANFGRECCVMDCPYDVTYIMGVKIPLTEKIIYFCSTHYKELEKSDNYERFWKIHKYREDKGDGVYFDPIDFWDNFNDIKREAS